MKHHTELGCVGSSIFPQLSRRLAVGMGAGLLALFASTPTRATVPPFYVLLSNGQTTASSVDLNGSSSVQRATSGVQIVNQLGILPGQVPQVWAPTPFAFANGDNTSFSLGVNITEWNTSAAASFEIVGTYTNNSAAVTTPDARLHIDPLDMRLTVGTPYDRDYSVRDMEVRYQSSLEVGRVSGQGFQATTLTSQNAVIRQALNGQLQCCDQHVSGPAGAQTFELWSLPVATINNAASDQTVSLGPVNPGDSIYYSYIFSLNVSANGTSGTTGRKPFLGAMVGDPLSVDASDRMPLIRIVDGSLAAPVPEPQTWALMLAGVGLLCAAYKRRHRAKPEITHAFT